MGSELWAPASKVVYSGVQCVYKDSELGAHTAAHTRGPQDLLRSFARPGTWRLSLHGDISGPQIMVQISKTGP